MNTQDEVNAILWMIAHYTDLANSAWETYPNLEDAYLMYDYNMVHVKLYQSRLDKIFGD